MKSYISAVLIAVSFSMFAQITPPAPVFNPRTVFTDDFESGDFSKWTTTGAGANAHPFDIDSSLNKEPATGSKSAKMDRARDRMHRNLMADNGGKKIWEAARVSFWIYFGPKINEPLYRVYGEVRSYTGTGLPNGGTTADGAISQLLAAGAFNTTTLPGEAYDVKKFQGRVLVGGRQGWFNLNENGAPDRSPGWHLFEIERSFDGRTIKFYVDTILAKTITGVDNQGWDTLIMGPGLTSDPAVHDAHFDGFKVVVNPDLPTIRYSHGSFSQNEITVYFSEAMGPSVEQSTNWVVSGATVSAAKLVGPSTVKLTTSALTPYAPYTVKALFAEDRDNPANMVPVLASSFTAFPPPKFSSDFSVPPARAKVYGGTIIDQGVLKLSVNDFGQFGSFIIDDLDAGNDMLAFIATFKLRVGGGTSLPADGFSFNYAANIPDNNGAGIALEEGFGSGVTVSFDTWYNAEFPDQAQSIDLKYTNGFKAKQIQRIESGNNFVDVVIIGNPGGTMDVMFNNQIIHQGVLVFDDFANYTAGRFAFGARTGGAHENAWVDDLQITTIYPQVDQTAPTLLGATPNGTKTNLVVSYSEAVTDSALTLANYNIPGLAIKKATRQNANIVVLETDPQQALRNYILTINGVQDTAVVANTIAANTQHPFTGHDESVTFFTDFSGYPSGGKIYHSTEIANGVLKLTESRPYQTGVYIVNDLNGGKRLDGFDASFKLRIGEGTSPIADGFSFNFGTGYPNNPWPIFVEDGIGNGLSISFDTFDNGGGEAPALDVKFNGTPLVRLNLPSFGTGAEFIPVRVLVDATGKLTLFFNSQKLVSDFQVLPGPTPGQFALAGRTGGLSARHWVDDLSIKTFVTPPDLIKPELISLQAGLGPKNKIYLTFSEPMLANLAGALTNYSLSAETVSVALASAAVSADGRNVTLTTAEPMAEGVEYELTIRNLTDRANTPNDQGPNPLDPNPTVALFRLAFIAPNGTLTQVNGFQDDFTGSQRNPLWIPLGPGGDVYTFDGAAGVIKVGNADSTPNHLVYAGEDYDPENQEVLMRFRVKSFDTAGNARAGASLSVNPDSAGLNWQVYDDGVARSLLFQIDNESTLPITASWEMDTYYWMRLKNSDGKALGKFWIADGSVPEPVAWQVWDHGSPVSGLAGILAGSFNAPSEYEVDYFLLIAEGLPAITVDPMAARGITVPDDCGLLLITRIDGETILTWEGTCQLLESEFAEGPYSPVPGNPAPPYKAPDGLSHRFYKLGSEF